MIETNPANHEPTERQALGHPERSIVVVQYRRGLLASLAIPVLIMIAALAVLSHRIRVEDWPGISRFYPHEEVAEPEVAAEVESAPKPVAAATVPASPPIVLRLVPSPRIQPPPVQPPLSPPEAAMPAPSLLVNREPAAQEPTVVPAPETSVEAAPPPAVDHIAKAAPPPPPLPVVDAEDIWKDIQKESDRKQEEARVLDREKDRMHAEGAERDAEQKVAAQNRRENEQNNRRLRFREDLRQALKTEDGRPGVAIRDLCAREGVKIGANWRQPLAPKTINTSNAKKILIDKLRASGASEAMIFNELARLEDLNRVARKGAKTQEEVLIRAARQLLAVAVVNRANEITRSPIRAAGTR